MAEGNTTAWGSNSAGNYGFSGQYTAGVQTTKGVTTLNTGNRGLGASRITCSATSSPGPRTIRPDGHAG